MFLVDIIFLTFSKNCLSLTIFHFPDFTGGWESCYIQHLRLLKKTTTDKNNITFNLVTVHLILSLHPKLHSPPFAIPLKVTKQKEGILSNIKK